MRQTVKRVFNQEKRSGTTNEMLDLCTTDIRTPQTVSEGAMIGLS